jgi:LPS export ABC transporter protein LptC
MKYPFYLFFSLLIFFSCENDMADIDRLVGIPTEPGTDMAKDVVAYYSDSAIVRAVLKAPLMKIRQNANMPQREFPNGLTAIFYDASKQASSYMTSKYALRNERDGVVLLRDSVVIWNINNEKIETEELIWDDKTAQLTSEKFVKITTPEKTITGFGFISNREFTQWTIKHISGWTKTTDFIGDSPLNGQGD